MWRAGYRCTVRVRGVHLCGEGAERLRREVRAGVGDIPEAGALDTEDRRIEPTLSRPAVVAKGLRGTNTSRQRSCERSQLRWASRRREGCAHVSAHHVTSTVDGAGVVAADVGGGEDGHRDRKHHEKAEP